MADENCFSCNTPMAECQCGGTEGFSSWCMVCPHCGHFNRPEDSDGEAYDESTTEYPCGDCGKDFGVKVYVSHTWITRRLTD